MNRFFSILMLLTLLFNPAIAIVEDDFVNATLKDKIIEKPKANLNYNYENTEIIPIKLKILEPIKSEKDLYEGQVIKFQTVEYTTYNGEPIIEAGTPVTAKVETTITNGMNGIPGSVVIGGFHIPNIPDERLSANYEKYGMDLSLLVFPLKWALTILPPTGSLTNFIFGGHAKVSTRKPITIYYYPPKA